MASKLPPKKGANLSFGEHCSTCGSWLACDASDAVFELNRVDAIASKPAPTIKGVNRSFGEHHNNAIHPISAGRRADHRRHDRHHRHRRLAA